MWATATGKRPDCGSVQFGPMYISSPVDWTCEHYMQTMPFVIGFLQFENVGFDSTCHQIIMCTSCDKTLVELRFGTTSYLNAGEDELDEY